MTWLSIDIWDMIYTGLAFFRIVNIKCFLSLRRGGAGNIEFQPIRQLNTQISNTISNPLPPFRRVTKWRLCHRELKNIWLMRPCNNLPAHSCSNRLYFKQKSSTCLDQHYSKRLSFLVFFSWLIVLDGHRNHHVLQWEESEITFLIASCSLEKEKKYPDWFFRESFSL